MALPARSEQPILFWILLLVVSLTPLPYGSAYAWAWGLMASVVGVLLLIWSGRVILGLQEVTIGLQRTWFLVVPFILVIGWIALQTSSLPPWRWHHPLWQTAREALGADFSGAISLNPYQSVSHLARLLGYGAIFWLALQYCRKSVRAKQVLFALAAAGFVYAVYGLIEMTFFAPAKAAGLASTFVDAEAYASYAGLTLLCLTALIQVAVAQKTKTVLSLMTRDAFTAQGLAAGAAMEKPRLWSARGRQRLVTSMNWVDVWLLAAWITVLTALIASRSHSGVVAGLFGLATLILVFALTRSVRRGYAATVAAGIVLALGLAFSLAGSRLEGWLVAAAHDIERPRLQTLAVEAIEAAPLLGSGYGTFEEVFRFYRASDIDGYYVTAHNTYLENVLELGLPAALILFGVLIGFLTLTIRGIRTRGRDVIYPCVGLAATIIVAVHSAVGSSLQVPAIAASYALVMGAACAQCWSGRAPKDDW